MFRLGVLFQSFQSPNFRLLWLSSLAASGGMLVQQVAVGWLVLEMTDSPFALGIVAAARMIPSFFLGMIAGVVADRVDRRKLLLLIEVLGAGYSFAMAAIVAAGIAELWQVVALTLVYGCTRAFEWTARQALVYDVVGETEALRGMALNGLAMRSMGVLGAVVSGALIPAFGVQSSFIFMGIGYVVGALALMGVHTIPVQRSTPHASVRSSFGHGMALVRDNGAVRGLVMLSILTEIFGFSYQTLMPIFARDILGVGAVGLGVLSGARSIGAILSTLVLAALAHYQEKMRLLVGAFGLYGLFLVCFAASTLFPLSLVISVGIGAVASASDILQQTLLQLNVPNEDRGRVMGYWVVSLGFGPIGHLELGALAVATASAPFAMGVNGSVMLAVFLALAIASRNLSRKGPQKVNTARR